MKTLCSIFALVLAASFFVSPRAFGDQNTGADFARIDEAWWADMGAATTNLERIANQPDHSWQLIKIVSGDTSGITPSNRKEPIVVRGTYSVVQTLGKAESQTTGTYKWRFPQLQEVPEEKPMAWFDFQQKSLPFDSLNCDLTVSATRFAVCNLNQNASQLKDFRFVNLVPNAWIRYVFPAALYLRSHPKLAEHGTTAERRFRFAPLLHNGNPYLVLYAVRILASHNELDPRLIESIQNGPDPDLYYACLYVLGDVQWDVHTKNAIWFCSQVDKVRTVADLAKIVYSISPPDRPVVRSNSEIIRPIVFSTKYMIIRKLNYKSIMRHIQTRLGVLGPTDAMYDYYGEFVMEACDIDLDGVIT